MFNIFNYYTPEEVLKVTSILAIYWQQKNYKKDVCRYSFNYGHLNYDIMNTIERESKLRMVRILEEQKQPSPTN